MRGPKPASIGLLAAAAFALLAACGEAGGSADLDEAGEVVRELRESFIDQERLSAEELNAAAIKGILDYLDDPYTAYLSPEQYQNFTATLAGETGEFEGIGADVTLMDGRLLILGPRPDSPASRAGIRPGDIVVAVDGVDIKGLDLPEAVDLIRGPKGSTVVLRIIRPGALRSIDISVVRDTIRLTNVNARMQEDGVGYIGVGTFDAKTADGLREAIAGLRSEGARGLVLDLRNNTGGLVDAAVRVVSEFVESGLVFVVRNNDAADEEYEATGEGTAYDLPLVVLVNGFSASASEIVSGALQDHDRAVVVGVRTFGKGSVNQLSQLDSGSGLYVTIARWLTPNGRVIEAEGIEPDVVVGDPIDVRGSQRVSQRSQALCEAFDEDREALTGQDELIAAIDEFCHQPRSGAPAPQNDEQLEAAVVELRKLMDGKLMDG